MNRRRIFKYIFTAFTALLILVIAGMIGFGQYLKARSGPEFEGELASLLPPNTVFYFSFNQPAQFLDGFERSRLWLEWERTGAMRAALDRKERLAKLQRNVEKIERFTPYTVKDRIVKRWLGHHFVVALVPPPRPGLPPGIIVLAKTDTGFEEDLAQFVAENFPDVRRQKSDSPAGESITLYRGSKPHRSLAFVRFGRTVALSLRSPETAYLEDMIRRRHDPEGGSLASVASFAAWQTAEGGAHPLTLYCHPAESARLFLDHPGLRPEEASRAQSIEWFFDKTEKGALLTGWMEYKRDLKARFELATPGPLFNLENLAAAAPRFESLDFATGSSLAFVAVKSDDVARLTAWLRQAANLTKKGPENWEQANETLEDALGRRFTRTAQLLLDREAALIIQGVSPALLMPQVDAVGYVGLDDTALLRDALLEKSAQTAEVGDGLTTHTHYNIGRLSLPVFALRGAGAMLADDPPALVLAASTNPMEPLRPAWSAPDERPLMLPLDDEAHTLAAAYVNTRRLERLLDAVYVGIPVFAEELREDVERLLVYSTLLAPLDSLTLSFRATDSGLAVDLQSQ